MLSASTLVVVGVIWDISWHRTIGRDTFWTPAHVFIYLGGLIAGLAGAYTVLRTTLRGTPGEVAASVRFWGFRGPLGAWFAIWGAIAMLTSAPFDDWWHNAYGLDVKILSPPHAVLALGIFAIQLGAIFMVSPLRARARGDEARKLERLYLWTLGVLLLLASIMVSERHFPAMAHTSMYYRNAAFVFPLGMALAIGSSRFRWPATFVAAVYMGVTIVMMQVLQLFPGEPRLAPIYQHVTHMVPPPFPLLVILPAVAMDVLWHRLKSRVSDWIVALALGATFFVIFLVVQWFFAELMLSPAGANRFFAANRFSYNIPDTVPSVRREFYSLESVVALRTGIARAFVISLVAASVGLLWGRWMATVKR
jgi:hypothetical protein